MKRTEILKTIEQYETLGLLNTNIGTPNQNPKAISPNYSYIKKGFFNKLGSFFSVGLFRLAGDILSPCFKFKIEGKENLNGLKSAIVTSNHIHMFDCAFIKHAFKHKKLKITVAEFNNYKGLFGKILRSAGTMPFSSSVIAMKHFSEGVNYYLEHDNFILVYPESALWWCYEKPRPLFDGAYFFAVKNNVPIVPLFFTFRNLKKRKDGTYKKQFVLHIGKPIYPQDNLSKKENIAYLKEQNFEFNKNTYESFYNTKLSYDTIHAEKNIDTENEQISCKKQANG